MAYNLPGVDRLTLSRELIVGFYNGTITRWNDPAIQSLNSDVTLPDERIHVAARSDKSGMLMWHALTKLAQDFKITFDLFFEKGRLS